MVYPPLSFFISCSGRKKRSLNRGLKKERADGAGRNISAFGERKKEMTELTLNNSGEDTGRVPENRVLLFLVSSGRLPGSAPGEIRRKERNRSFGRDPGPSGALTV